MILSSHAHKHNVGDEISWMHPLPHSSSTLGAFLVFMHPILLCPEAQQHSVLCGQLSAEGHTSEFHSPVGQCGAWKGVGLQTGAAKTLTSPAALHVKGSWAHFIPAHPLWCSLRSLFNLFHSLRWDWATPKSFLISSITGPSRALYSFLLLQESGDSGGPDLTYLYVSVEHRGLLLIPLS